MHFHLPKPLHGWRELAGEVGIIVVGVLIALGAEQVVEAWQWRDKVWRAESAMRLELAEDDAPQAYGRVLVGPCLDAQILRIHDQAGHVPTSQLRQLVTDYAPPFRTWDSEAWKTVLGSDVGGHMGPERLIQWSSPYRIMPGLTDANSRERQLATELHEDLPPAGEPAAADLQKLRRDAGQLRLINYQFYRSSQLILARSNAVGAPVPVPMQHALSTEARAMYGKCARAPDLDRPPSAMNLNANLRSLPVEVGAEG